MWVVYALTLDLDGDEALAKADEAVASLAAELDPKTALVRCSVTDGKYKPNYRAAGLLHGGEGRLSDRQSRFE